MAVPTISTVSPATGPAGGRAVITITGTNFQPSPEPPMGGPGGILPDTVAVEFDGFRAERVDVVSPTQLRVLLPPYRRSGDDAFVEPLPLVSVRVFNIDEDGALITGETVTRSNAFRYVRSTLRAPDALEQDQQYRQVIREVVQIFQRQLVPNTSIGTNVDFGDFGQIVIKPAKNPSLTLIGPRVTEDKINRHHWTDFEEEDLEENDDPDMRALKWPAFLASFEFEGVLASDFKMELYAMEQGLIELFQRTPWIRIPVVYGDVNGEHHEFPLMLTAPPNVISQDPGSNLHTATFSFSVDEIPFRFDDSVALGEAISIGIEMQGEQIDGVFETISDDQGD